MYVKTFNWLLWLLIAVYGILAKLVFDNVYDTSGTVIDEEFHLPLGKTYCRFKFDKWHPKVTTLPGLYLLSSAILGPWDKCNPNFLRLIPFGSSILNIYLFYLLISRNQRGHYKKNVLSAINLALLPPLYFFSNLYYTDVPSLTMILLLLIFAQRENHFIASIFGMLSILFRQNNVIWVSMIAGYYFIRELYNLYQKKPLGEVKNFKQICNKLLNILKSTTIQFWLNILSYLSVLFVFGLFIIKNGGIVVGDHCSHEATIHLPQIFYFSLFTLFFGWPYFLEEIPKFLNFAKNNKLLIGSLLLIFILIVHYNTLVHPFLLADNRHYTFYIWNRFYGKYFMFRYLMIPIYLFALYGILSKLYNVNKIFLLMFILCTITALTTQKLLELRYFFVPYVIFRSFIKSHTTSLFLELLSNLLINGITLYLFFTKAIIWAEYDEPQRIIW